MMTLKRFLTSGTVALLLAVQAFAGTVTGVQQNAQGGPVANGTYTFQLTAPATIAGVASIATSTVNCYTDASGNVVGEPNPLVLPITSVNLSSGTLAAGNYFVKIWYFDGSGNSFPSPEVSVNLASPGTLTILSPIKQPANASGYRVGISTVSGSETLQGSITGTPGSWGNFSQSTALVAGSAAPVSNSTACSLHFNDEMTPSFVCYNVGLTYGANGASVPGYPQYWYLAGGANGIVNIANGTPQANVCAQQGIFYPQAILALPPFGSPQSIGGPLNIGGALAVTGNETVGGTLGVTGASTFTGGATFKGNPWYDITAYGAKCDGATDDTAAIQAALTAAQTAHGGNVFVPMGTNACIVAGQLVMDDYFDVSLASAGRGSPAGATPRGWLKFTGTTSPLISCKSCNGTTIKGLYLQYTNAAFAGTFIEYGHSALARDATGNRLEDNFIGKQSAGGTAAVLVSLDQAIDNILENNQLFDAAVAIRGRNNPTGTAATDYSVNNTIRANSFGISSANSITTAFIQNIGEGSVITGNDFELGGAAVAVLAYTGAMAAGGVISGGFVGDQSGASTFTMFTIPTNSAWQIEGMLIGPLSVNVTGVVMQNNASLSFMGNKLANGTVVGTMFSVGTGDSLVVGGNKWQGTVTTFLTGTPASGMVEDNTSHVRLPTGTSSIPGIAFLQNNAIGFTISTNNHLQVAYAGAGPFFSATQLAIGSAMTIVATSTTDPDAVGADTGLSRTAASVWGAGTGANGSTAGSFRAASFISGGAAAALTGTGACATFSTQTGGSMAGRATCTAATAASTLTITPGTTAPNGWVCYVQDQTTRANLFQQTSNTATSCTLTVTSVTQNDVFVFSAIAF